MRQLLMSVSHTTAREGGAMQDRARLRMRVAPPRGETRTRQQLREHYLIERELAHRLRSAAIKKEAL